VIVNGGNAVRALPSVTDIRIPGNDSLEPAGTLPFKRPVCLSKVAHAGLRAISKRSLSPSRSAACGTKL
jgi:hypothetical protein